QRHRDARRSHCRRRGLADSSHRGGSLADSIVIRFLIEGDGKEVFSAGDTAPCDAVRNGAAGVDVLIHEAMYFPPDSGHYRSHSHPVHVGEVARQAGASRLVLTHLQPGTKRERLLNDANKELTRPIVMATDQMRLVV